jgi:hypothetical protein
MNFTKVEFFISVPSTGCLGAGDSSAKFLVIVHLFDCSCIIMVAALKPFRTNRSTSVSRARASPKISPGFRPRISGQAPACKAINPPLPKKFRPYTQKPVVQIPIDFDKVETRPSARPSSLDHNMKERIVDRDYDLFERFPDGSLVWRAVVSGHGNALRKLSELAAQTSNEVHAMHVATNTVIAVTKPAPQ